MSQYKFQAGEMQEFVRGLFRADYGKEAGEIEACRRATIDTEPEEISIESGAIQIDSTQPIQTPSPMPTPSLRRIRRPSGRRRSRRRMTTGPQKAGQQGQPAGGLWSRLRDKFTK